MKKNSFLEYVDSKGKLKNPIISVDGDNLEVDKSPDKPEGGGNPYIAKSIKTNDKERIKGLGNSGNQDMIYQPAVDKSGKSKASDKAPAKIPTVNEISITSRYARTLSESPMLVENLVAQIKSKGMLGPLVAELLNHKETFNHISQIMAHESYGVNLCNKLVKALNEDVSQPFSDELGDEQPDDEQSNGDENEEDDYDFDDEDDETGDENYDFDDDDEGGDDENSDPDIDQSDADPLMDIDAVNGDGEPMNPNMAQGGPAMKNLHKAMMRAYMSKMMSKI